MVRIIVRDIPPRHSSHHKNNNKYKFPEDVGLQSKALGKTHCFRVVLSVNPHIAGVQPQRFVVTPDDDLNEVLSKVHPMCRERASEVLGQLHICPNCSGFTLKEGLCPGCQTPKMAHQCKDLYEMLEDISIPVKVALEPPAITPPREDTSLVPWRGSTLRCAYYKHGCGEKAVARVLGIPLCQHHLDKLYYEGRTIGVWPE